MSDQTSKPRVLVVDDERNIRDLVGVALRFHGFEVISASRGYEALDLARSAAPDLLVLDVMLPDLASSCAGGCAPRETTCPSSS